MNTQPPSLHGHYRILLGLDASREVLDVELPLVDKLVTITLKKTSEQVMCPDFQQGYIRYDHAPERQWRHLDTIQFETRIKAALARVNCPQCGIKTTTAPWAEKQL